MDFTLVFPSNAQADKYENTASQFQTDLANPFDLTGKWEVALQDMSYVNNVKTITNQSLMLGHAIHETRYFDQLESAEKVITLDLQKYSAEWKTAIRKQSRKRRHAKHLEKQPIIESTPALPIVVDYEDETLVNDAVDKAIEERRKKRSKDKTPTKKYEWKTYPEKYAYQNKIGSLLHVLNRIGNKLWMWKYDVLHEEVILYMQSIKNADYGFYVSEDLQKLLALKKRFFVPSSKFPYAVGADAFLLRTQYILAVSNAVQKIKNWDVLDLTITVLPLHRMDVKEIGFEEGTLIDLIKSVSKECAPYGLTVRSSTTQPYAIDITNTNELGKSRVVFIEINEELRDAFTLKQYIFWKKEHYEHDLQSRVPSNQKGCGVRIYLIRTSHLKSTSPMKWKLIQEVTLPSKHYSNGNDICTESRR